METSGSIDEKDLIQRLKQGQEWAYEVLVRRYTGKLLTLVHGITLDREESREIVQEVFLQVFRNIDSFQGDSGLSAWLRKTAVRRSLNWRRRWKRRFRWHHQSLDLHPEMPGEAQGAVTGMQDEDPEKKTLTREQVDIALKAVDGLPESLRTVFVLKVIEEMTYEEIAQLLNIRVGTVASRLHAARQKLTRTLSAE